MKLLSLAQVGEGTKAWNRLRSEQPRHVHERFGQRELLCICDRTRQMNDERGPVKGNETATGGWRLLKVRRLQMDVAAMRAHERIYTARRRSSPTASQTRGLEGSNAQQVSEHDRDP